MRVLYISVAYPLPANNGAKMRLWAILRAIKNAGHELSLASFAEPGEGAGTEQDLATVCTDTDIVTLSYTRLSAGGDYGKRLRGLLSSSPFTLERLRSSEMAERLKRRVREHSFDVIVCDNVFAAVNLPASASPVVMNSQNVEYRILQRYIEHERNPLKALYARVEAHKLRRFEAAMYRRAIMAMACSSVDTGLIRSLCPGIETAVAPNVVDVHEYPPAAGEEPLAVLYQGGMDWFPNRDALQYFVRDILPLVRKEVPGVRLVAAGRNPSPEFRAQFSDVAALEFTGTLADLRPVIAKAAVCVVPLRIGSGTRLKILEAGAMGKAMVSTSVGVEGLDFIAGKEILVADDPATFARDVVQLLNDPARRKALGEAARNRVLQDYDITALERYIATAFQKLQDSINAEGGKTQPVPVGEGEFA
jgi:glycosyltransferase involved in cell wall biosynthesis